MNWILFICFILLFAENRFKPRIDFTIYGDLVLWYYWKKERKFYILYKK